MRKSPVESWFIEMRNHPNEVKQMFIKYPEVAVLLREALEQPTETNMGMRARASVSSKTTLYSETAREPHAIVEEPATLRWLDAEEVGKGVGRSAKWVKEHRQLLPDAFCRKSECGHRAWLFSPASINLLNNYR